MAKISKAIAVILDLSCLLLIAIYFCYRPWPRLLTKILFIDLVLHYLHLASLFFPLSVYNLVLCDLILLISELSVSSVH